MISPRPVIVLPLTLLLVSPVGTRAQQASATCRDRPEFAWLDFWLGEWRVESADGEHYGDNVIEKILDGCAILEHWTARGGGQGKSLFYFHSVEGVWKQVWVTEQAATPGGLKEKVLVERLPDGAIRFQGEIPLDDDRSYLDRTTLTPLPDGRVRQVIETSRDGAVWRVGFDALYIRKPSG